MFLAELTDPPVAISIGGGVGVLGFVVALYKVYSQDRVWKSLIAEVRSELVDCRAERVADREHVRRLEGEVIALRRELHLDRWMGVEER